MDPASLAGLVATCYSIATCATGFITGIQDLRRNYKDVELNTHALVTQTEAVNSAANNIRKWLSSHETRLRSEERQSLHNSLEACRTIISAMFDGVREVLDERASGSTRWKFWDRVKFLWEQGQMEQYSIKLDHQIAALSLHLQALQL
jgi:CHASE3 domain sensor protein